MRRIPVDVSNSSFVVAEEPRALVDFDTKAPRVNDSGELLYSVNLLLTSASEISIITVKIPSVVGSFSVNDPVHVVGLSAVAWVNNGKAAVSFSADRLESIAKAKAA